MGSFESYNPTYNLCKKILHCADKPLTALTYFKFCLPHSSMYLHLDTTTSWYSYFVTSRIIYSYFFMLHRFSNSISFTAIWWIQNSHTDRVFCQFSENGQVKHIGRLDYENIGKGVKIWSKVSSDTLWVVQDQRSLRHTLRIKDINYILIDLV